VVGAARRLAVVAVAHDQGVVPGLAEPSAPAWEPGPQPMARWRADVLAAIAAELGLPAPYLLRWTTQRAGAMTAEGYGLIVAVDGLDWTGLYERMLLSAGIGPDMRSPMARRIGFGSAYSAVEGPNEIVAVGADAHGRNAVQARERDYERWRG
ncbi:hypothetical protein, partial [Mesorhizobium japonicum]|uniref:hypothetical protein n=1 Tax=Mesorhizobium japonicum TaxID=2066070 RepID=UPI003B5A1028